MGESSAGVSAPSRGPGIGGEFRIQEHRPAARHHHEGHLLVRLHHGGVAEENLRARRERHAHREVHLRWPSRPAGEGDHRDDRRPENNPAFVPVPHPRRAGGARAVVRVLESGRACGGQAGRGRRRANPPRSRSSPSRRRIPALPPRSPRSRPARNTGSTSAPPIPRRPKAPRSSSRPITPRKARRPTRFMCGSNERHDSICQIGTQPSSPAAAGGSRASCLRRPMRAGWKPAGRAGRMPAFRSTTAAARRRRRAPHRCSPA